MILPKIVMPKKLIKKASFNEGDELVAKVKKGEIKLRRK